MKRPALCFEHVPNFVVIPLQVQNIPKSQTLWRHPDPTLIGRSLVAQATYELEEQHARNKSLREQGKVPNSFFGREFELFDKYQVTALRKSVLENCGRLAKLVAVFFSFGKGLTNAWTTYEWPQQPMILPMKSSTVHP